MELSKIEYCLINSVVNPSPEKPHHRFSLRYKIRKRKIIKEYERSLELHRQLHRVNLKYLLIAVITAGIAVLSGFGMVKIIEGFRVTDYDTHSMLFVVDDLENSPTEIEKKFWIDLDMSEYGVEVLSDDYVLYGVQYESDNKRISVLQMPLVYYSQRRLNTENALIEPMQISINDWSGLYFQTNDGGYYYLFNTGEYILSYTSNLPKEDIENIVKSTKFE